MFTCDEEALRQHDSTFSNVSDTKDVDPDVLHSVWHSSIPTYIVNLFPLLTSCLMLRTA